MTTETRTPVTKMLISEAGIDFIKSREGCVLVAYDDVGGVRTIGYGHTGGVKYNEHITRAGADALLISDLGLFQKGLDRLVTVPLLQREYDALMSFEYNIGVEAFARSDVLKALNADDYAGVPQRMMAWTRAGNDRTALTKRRRSEAQQFAGSIL